MKLSSSSSLLFATLAISSSSSSLAAPAGDTAHSEGMSDAAQHSALTARRASTSFPVTLTNRNDIHSVHERREGIFPMLEGLPVIGGLITPVVNILQRDLLPSPQGVVPVSAPGLPLSPANSSLPVPSTPQKPSGSPLVPPGLSQRSDQGDIDNSSSADASYTSTATDASSSATQASMVGAAAVPPAAPVQTITIIPFIPITPPSGPNTLAHPALPAPPAPTPALPPLLSNKV